MNGGFWLGPLSTVAIDNGGLRDELPPGTGEPEPGTRIPNDTCAACGYPRQVKPFCPHCGHVPA